MNGQQASGGIGSAPNAAGSNQSSGEQGVRRDEALSKVADVAQQAGSQAKQAASSLAADANHRAKGFLNQQVASASDLAGHVADSVRSAADKSLGGYRTDITEDQLRGADILSGPRLGLE